MLILILVALTGNGLGLMIGSLFSDAKVAAAISPAFLSKILKYKFFNFIFN